MRSQAILSLLFIAIALYETYMQIKELRGRVRDTIVAIKCNIDFLKELFREGPDPWTDIRET